MGSKKQKQTTTTNQVSNQTTTPTVASWMQPGFKNLWEQIGDFGNVDPQSLVAGASPLQQQAFGQAAQLGSGQGNSYLNQSGSLLASLAGSGANVAGMQGYTPTTGQAQGYDAVTGQASTYNPSTIGQTAQVGPMQQVSGGSVRAVGLLDKGLEQYLNPYQSQVTDAYTADFDETAGQTRAAQSAQAALNGAFSGSRYGIQEAQTEGELARARASGLAGILQGGFDRATSLADADANRAQGAASQSAANALQASLANAAAQNQAQLTNAGYQQQGLLANLDALNQAGQFNAGAQNQFGLSNLAAQNQAAQYSASAANQYGLANMDALNSAGQFNANAYNQNQQFNANQQDANNALRLSAAGALGDLGNSMSANNRADLGLLAQLGEQQRGIDQAGRTAGLSQLQALASLYGAFPSNLFTSQTTNGTVNGTNTTTQQQNNGLLGTIGQGAQIAGSLASLFSDARLKENIRHVGQRPDGINLYKYNYIWSDEEITGVMAHEVLQVRPEAVGNIGGYLTVDYGVLDVQ